MNLISLYSRAAVLLAVSAGLLASQPGVAGDWPRWRGPDLDGISKERGWKPAFSADGPKVLWKAEVGKGFASVSVADGLAYTTGNASDTDTVYALDVETGRVVWKHSYPHPLDPKYYEGGTSATPTVDGGRVYTLSKRGHMHVLDAKTGAVIWGRNVAEEIGAKMPTWGYAGSVVIDGDMAVLNVGTHGLAVDKNTGKVLWKTGAEEAGYATPVPFTHGGQKLYLIFAAKELVAVRAATGEKVWSHKWETSYDVNAAYPVICGPDRVFIASGYNTGGALLDVSGGKPKVVWQNKNIRSHFNPAILVGKHLYAIDGDVGKAQLRAVDMATGAVAWTFKDPNHGAILVSDGKLIVISERGELMVGNLSPAGFKPTSRAQVSGGKFWTVPVLANGRLYVRNAEGLVTCLDLRP